MNLLADRQDSILLLVAQEALDVRVRDGIQGLKRLLRAQSVQFLTDFRQVDAFGAQVDVAVFNEKMRVRDLEGSVRDEESLGPLTPGCPMHRSG